MRAKRPTRLSLAVSQLLATGFATTVVLAPPALQAGELTLYVDKKTNQVYTSPGRNRVRLGEFKQIDEKEPAAAAGKAAPANVTERIDALEQKVEDVQTEAQVAKEQNNVAEQLAQVVKGKWYEKLKLGGYTQFRLTDVFNRGDDPKAPNLSVPNDNSVGDGRTFGIRRGRLKIDGDVSNHLYLYGQVDFAGGLGGTGGQDLALQARDLYADVAFDAAKEHRVRLGLSKVPFGWSNMQSSQNRAAIERADAINSAAEGERDYGVYYMWAPAEKRELFKDLIKAGFKGSGDYGVAALGVYGGQGPNRFDKSFNLHYAAHFSYPFKLASGQYVEFGVDAYTGRFVPSTTAFDPKATVLVTPSGGNKNGLQDRRVAAHFIWYPQPIGLEVEWNVGDGPELSKDGKSVGVGFLHGGYVQTNYKLDSSYGTFFPYGRWQYYDGGRKFAANAPHERVNEFELGMEYLPWPELELTAAFVHSFHRTDTTTFPYRSNVDADRVTVQAQWNY